MPGEYAVGYKGVSYHEDFFRGHFPQKAVMPGVLILRGTCSDRSCGNFKCTGKSGKDCIFRWCTEMPLQRNGISGRSVETGDKDH